MANVNHFDSDHFEAALAQPAWCWWTFSRPGACPAKMVAPVIEKVAESYAGKVTVGKVDIDEEPDLAAAYNVQSVPSILLFKDGKLASTLVGARPFETFATPRLDKLV